MCSESCATAPLAILCRRFAVQPRDRVSRELQSLRISRCGGTDGSPTAARLVQSQSFKCPREEKHRTMRSLANSNRCLPNPPPPLVATTRTRGVRVVSTGATGLASKRTPASVSNHRVAPPFPQGARRPLQESWVSMGCLPDFAEAAVRLVTPRSCNGGKQRTHPAVLQVRPRTKRPGAELSFVCGTPPPRSGGLRCGLFSPDDG